MGGGVGYHVKDTNIVLYGGVDDIWYKQDTEQVIIVDYKSQASSSEVSEANYMSNVYHQSYKTQMDIYSYLMAKNGFEVFSTSYFYVCNADRGAENFSGKLNFSETLIPYKWDISWIDQKIQEMIRILNSEQLPDSNFSCENCAYAKQRTIKEAPVTRAVAN